LIKTRARGCKGVLEACVKLHPSNGFSSSQSGAPRRQWKRALSVGGWRPLLKGELTTLFLFKALSVVMEVNQVACFAKQFGT